MESRDSCWLDVTEEFRSSVAQLELGELLKQDQFTLLEAMSAIEMMDPKMDGGMIFRKIDRTLLTFEQAIRSGAVKINHLEPEELIGVIDDTYACLVTWFEGHSLSQTVMTNLYLHDPERIEDKCLRVFSQSMLKIVDVFDRLVATVYCIEEEDFQLNNCKFKLAQHLNDQKILSSLEDLCHHYERLALAGEHQQQHHNAKSSTQNNPSSGHNQQQQQQTKQTNQTNHDVNGTADPDKAKRLNGAILARLRFTHNLYAFLLNISKNLLPEPNVSGPNSAALTQKAIKLVQSTAISCDLSLDNCLKYLDSWRETIEMGVKPSAKLNNTDDPKQSFEGDYPTIMGFEPLVNYRLVTPSYPRCPSIKTRPETLDSIKELIIKLRECILVSNNFYQKSFIRSLEAIEKFSKYFQPKSCVISRSFMLILYLPIRVGSMLKDELIQSLTEFCEPLMTLIKKDPIKSQAITEFINESMLVFCQVITLYGHNPARQQEKISDLMNSFKNLQYLAYLVNDVLRNNFAYSWTTYHFAKLCIKYVRAGLELELILPHEYTYVFWYLSEVLYRNEKSELEYAKRLMIETHLVAEQQSIALKGAPGKANKKTKNKRNPFFSSFHDRNLILNDGLRLLTGGMFLLTCGLELQGKIKLPSLEFTTEEIFFEHRFGSITGTTVFCDYRLKMSRLCRLDLIYNEAFECFSEARKMFERYGQGQEDCLTVCKSNMVVARLLCSNPKPFADREVEFCFDRHPSFPTVKL